MGRALLIITLGSFIILGIIQQAVNNRQINMTEGNIESFMVSHGRNLTGSALEVAINRILFDYDNAWESSFNSETTPLWTFPIEDMNVDIFVDDENQDGVDNGLLRVSAVTQIEGRRITSQAFLNRGGDLEWPVINAAIAVYGQRKNRIDFRGRGARLKASGIDTSPPGYPSPPTDAENLPAIAAQIPEDDLVDTSGNVEYDGQPSPYNQYMEDNDDLKDLIDNYLAMVDKPYTHGDNLGTRDNPEIIKITPESGSDVKFESDEDNGVFSGAGILIITEGAHLSILGNFDFYGLVIVRGSLRMGGTPSIFGGLIMTDNASVEQDGSASVGEGDDGFLSHGTPTVQYSSQVLATIKQNLSGGSGSSWAFNRILY